MVLVARLVVTAIAIWVASALMDSIDIKAPDDNTVAKILVLLGIAAVFTAVNAFVKPIVKLLSLPLVILTLGLFLLVINALMLMLTAWITEAFKYGLTVSGFWSAVGGSIIIAIVNWLLSALVPDDD